MAAGIGSGAITHRRVLRIALPIVLSNATIPILGAVDTAVVGQLGQAAPIGAVGIGAVILTTIYWVFGFLRMGTTGLVAQARGAGEVAETGALLMRGLMIAFAAGLLFIAGQAGVFWAAFRLAPASAEVEALARSYLAIRIWGAPATIALYALTGWLIAMERTRSVLVLQVGMNAANVVLAVSFVLGFGWGVPGVATATLISEWGGLLLGLWLCRAAFAGSQWRDWGRVLDPERLRRMAAVNRDILIRSVILQASFTSFLFLGAGLGDVTLAANQVLLQFLSITAYALDGFAFAAEALVGQTLGRHDRAGLRRAAVVSSEWGVGFSVVLAAVFLLAGPPLIDAMAAAPDVRAEARAYLAWVAAAPLIGIAAWMLDGIFIGATETRALRNAMGISVAIYVAALALLLPAWGNHGLWAALMVLNAARGVTLGLRYPALEARAGRVTGAAAGAAR
jgi:MATE family multidrug resistance protein